VRWKPPRSPVRPTSLGLWYIATAFIVGLAAVNTGNNLLFLIFSLMLATLLVSGVLSRAAMRNLGMSRRIPTTIYAGTPFTEAIAVSNRKRVFPSVSLQLRTAIATSSVHLAHVPPRGERTLVLEGLYPHRGRFKVEPLEMSSLYPLGFFERRRRMTTDQTVTVFPHVERILPFFHERRGGMGDRTALLKGEGDDLYQIREYVPGESARLIDWKSTGRVAKLMARDFHRSSDLRVTILVDATASGTEELEALEREISLAASIIDYLHRNQSAYQLVTHQDRIPFDAGPRHYIRSLTHLALLRPRTPQEGPHPFRGIAESDTRDSIVILFTAGGAAPGVPVKTYRVFPAAASET